jgi:ABC-2 type transport system permease protein
MLASLGPVLLLFGLLIPASIGLGMTIALLTSSESQVIQLALLVLLASVFFGGLAIDLTQFARPLQIGAELLPVTQATRLGQDLFLRGGIGEVWRYGVLAAMVVVLSASAWLLLRRDLMLRR